MAVERKTSQLGSPTPTNMLAERENAFRVRLVAADFSADRLNRNATVDLLTGSFDQH